MAVTYEEAVKAQQEIEDGLLENPNVVSIGVIAETDGFGRRTGDYVIQVGIVSSEEYWRSQKSGQFIIPEKYYLKSESGSQEIRIAVKREGKIYPQSNILPLGKRGFPTAMTATPAQPSRTSPFAVSKYQPQSYQLTIFRRPYSISNTVFFARNRFFSSGNNLGSSFLRSRFFRLFCEANPKTIGTVTSALATVAILGLAWYSEFKPRRFHTITNQKETTQDNNYVRNTR